MLEFWQRHFLIVSLSLWFSSCSKCASAHADLILKSSDVKSFEAKSVKEYRDLSFNDLPFTFHTSSNHKSFPSHPLNVLANFSTSDNTGYFFAEPHCRWISAHQISLSGKSCVVAGTPEYPDTDCLYRLHVQRAALNTMTFALGTIYTATCHKWHHTGCMISITHGKWEALPRIDLLKCNGFWSYQVRKICQAGFVNNTSEMR